MNRALILLVALLAVTLQATTLATTVSVVSVEKLTKASTDVVRARVESVESFWNKDRTAIYSRVTLRSEKVLRGSVPSEFTVLLPGGTVEGKTTIVVGAPEFRQQQDVVLFLTRIAEPGSTVGLSKAQMSGYRLTDLFQGVFNVNIDSSTGQPTAVSNVIKLVDQPETRPETLELGARKGLSLEVLEGRIGLVP